MTQFEDGLGNPIKAGDRFVYTLSGGSSSPTFGRGVVFEIDPVIEDPNDLSFKPRHKYLSQKKPVYGDYAVQVPYQARGKINAPWAYRIRFHSISPDWTTIADAKARVLHRVDQAIVVEALI